MSHVSCKLLPEQNKVEVWKGDDLIGVVHDESLMWFIPDGCNQFVEISFLDMDIIRDNWNQMVEMRRERNMPIIFKCPHCGGTKNHQMGPDDESAICGECDTPFNT